VAAATPMRRLEVNDEPVAVSNRLDPQDSVVEKDRFDSRPGARS
jgi:hypothetical protein